jgi:hypothetical protein
VAVSASPLQPVETVRLTPDTPTALANLGLLRELAGTWQGEGFNLIARPDFSGGANLYLQVNQTRETIQFTPIGSAIPNRGFGQADIQLFGLTYLDRISDVFTGGALHIEPGIWVTQPPTDYPPESPAPAKQIVARMASIPHGNALLAQGTADVLDGEFPTLTTATAQYTGSVFPSFNSTPFGAAPAPASPKFNAAGSSEKLTAPALVPPAAPFTQYDLTVPPSAANPRTPFGTSPPDPPLPTAINGVPMQDVINDPITLLQAVVDQQKTDNYTFSGAVLNIATQRELTFLTTPNAPTGATSPVTVVDGAGGIENILFLEGGEPVGANGPNAQTAQVYATFWLEQVHHPGRESFSQLQYAQMTVLDFEILKLLPAAHVNLGWPHISVATLRRSFL